MKREDKQNLLVSKMQKEFDEFRMETLKLPKEQIFDKAYEISSKEDIHGYVESEELSSRQLDVLLSKENTIDTMYMAWLKTDTYHSQDIDNCLWRVMSENQDKERGSTKETENNFETEEDFEDEDDFER